MINNDNELDIGIAMTSNNSQINEYRIILIIHKKDLLEWIWAIEW